MEMEAQRTRSSSASSPEFEFWMVRNPSCPPPEFLTADELFADGLLLPLQLLSLPRSDHAVQPLPDPPPSLTAFPPVPPPPPPPPSPPPPEVSVLLSASSFSSSSAPSSVSRRWKDLFKVVADKKPEEKEKERKKARKGNGSGGSAGGSSVELNINIWPFSRSRSAGNTAAAGSRARTVCRKVSSAPCSRSNSRGESSKPPSAGTGSGRRWATSPGRGGVHVGRTSPVWQIRRPSVVPKEKAGKSAASAAGAASGDGGGVRVLNLKVNSCIGYGNKVSCRTDDRDGVTGGDSTAETSSSHGSLFSLRTLFSKKVY